MMWEYGLMKLLAEESLRQLQISSGIMRVKPDLVESGRYVEKYVCCEVVPWIVQDAIDRAKTEDPVMWKVASEDVSREYARNKIPFFRDLISLAREKKWIRQREAELDAKGFFWMDN